MFRVMRNYSDSAVIAICIRSAGLRGACRAGYSEGGSWKFWGSTLRVPTHGAGAVGRLLDVLVDQDDVAIGVAEHEAGRPGGRLIGFGSQGDARIL